MNQPALHKPVAGRKYWSWLAFWAQFLVLGLLAIIGAFFASEGSEPGDYGAGLWLSLAAIALGFLRLRRYFDAGRTDWPTFLFVEDMRNLTAVIVVFAILGLAGLLIAADWREGSLHNAGIALFAASGLGVFLSLKRVFDKLESHR
jgi:hypothetical protein